MEPITATFLARPNRFVADVSLNGRKERVHVPNTGRMRELLRPGALVALRRAEREGRVTAYDVWAVRHGGIWVCVDSRAANDVVGGLLRQGLDGAFGSDAPGESGIHRALEPLLRDMTGFRNEVRVGAHRFDFAIEKGGRTAPVEVKSVNLVLDGVAMFPDAPTERGARHARALSQWAKGGGEAYILFVVQRSDAAFFRPNRSTDSDFADALIDAHASGVGLVALGSRVDPRSITATHCLPIELERRCR